jgi:predicted RNA binding protein YcfA (HicA-like mRNA interferase family)
MITEKNENLPNTEKDMHKYLKNLGFEEAGGTVHKKYTHKKSGMSVQVPRHGSKAFGAGTAHKIVKQAVAAAKGIRETSDLLATFRRIINKNKKEI